MVKIDFNEYDELSKMEYMLRIINDTMDMSKTYITLQQYEHQLMYILSIISILYKEKCYEEYLKTNVNGELNIDTVEQISELIDTISENLQEKNIYEIIKIIKNNGFVIQTLLERYFSKNKNYITKKYSMEIIKSQNKQKELLKYNPFEINKILNYEQNPLTKEEIIIQEIIEFLVESEQIYMEKEETLNNIKELMKKNYNEEKLNEVISFIISNIYQEMKENLHDENRNVIVPIIENDNLNPKHIIDHFKSNSVFSNMILNDFLYYNLNIEEGRLEELKQKPSNIYAKRIYRKNP